MNFSEILDNIIKMFKTNSYRISEKGVLMGVSKSLQYAVIPSNVTEIAKEAFLFSNVKSVVIPEGVKKLGKKLLHIVVS